VEKSITYEPWHDLIGECLKQADYLIDDFFDLLHQYNDIKEICKWMKNMNINCDQLNEPVFLIKHILFHSNLLIFIV